MPEAFAIRGSGGIISYRDVFVAAILGRWDAVSELEAMSLWRTRINAAVVRYHDYYFSREPLNITLTLGVDALSFQVETIHKLPGNRVGVTVLGLPGDHTLRK